MNEMTRTILENLRWSVWAIARLQVNHHDRLFTSERFNVMMWTKDHHCSSANWTKYRRSAIELSEGVGTKHDLSRCRNYYWLVRQREAHKRRKLYAKRFEEISRLLSARFNKRPDVF